MTLRETCYSLLHGFTSRRPFSHYEQVHDHLRAIARLLLQLDPFEDDTSYHHHLSPMRSETGAHDILHLCSVLFLGSAIYRPAYSTAGPPISRELKQKFMHGRDLAHRLMARLFSVCSQIRFHEGYPVQNQWSEVYYRFVALQVLSIADVLEKLQTPLLEMFNDKIDTLRSENDDFEEAMKAVKADVLVEQKYGWYGDGIEFHFQDGAAPFVIMPYEGTHGSSQLEWYEGCIYPKCS
ncbi:hypothetical protein NP233_g13110 [Leucocoprinus birnbaumii]|uniref:Uncharacterized protein n=1 Tax=Leucocoprinus birnbaumii TaxID=56174 RepID=A0AAD5YIW1_9AGAR|nr:hypothetical protein NP233_g13110 [Leucocoprinus birnbaumii]